MVKVAPQSFKVNLHLNVVIRGHSFCVMSYFGSLKNLNKFYCLSFFHTTSHPTPRGLLAQNLHFKHDQNSCGTVL